MFFRGETLACDWTNHTKSSWCTSTRKKVQGISIRTCITKYMKANCFFCTLTKFHPPRNFERYCILFSPFKNLVDRSSGSISYHFRPRFQESWSINFGMIITGEEMPNGSNILCGRESNSCLVRISCCSFGQLTSQDRVSSCKFPFSPKKGTIWFPYPSRNSYSLHLCPLNWKHNYPHRMKFSRSVQCLWAFLDTFQDGNLMWLP